MRAVPLNLTRLSASSSASYRSTRGCRIMQVNGGWRHQPNCTNQKYLVILGQEDGRLILQTPEGYDPDDWVVAKSGRGPCSCSLDVGPELPLASTLVKGCPSFSRLYVSPILSMTNFTRRFFTTLVASILHGKWIVTLPVPNSTSTVRDPPT